MKIVDARKKICPKPVIMTKKAADEGAEQITVIVDNETAKSNVIKLSSKLEYITSVEIKSDGIYIILNKDTTKSNQALTEKITNHQNIINKTNENNGNNEKNKYNETNEMKISYLISTDILGKGSDELGKILMKSFIYTISEKKPYPDCIIFLNSGVKLTAEGSECIDDLIKLEEGNVKIVSCGTCLDFFEIKRKLKVGTISNMYDIVDLITSSTNIVTL